eukprot:TCALIF_04763-PA protein Name:"Protein of unknown function" AED:0.04 eAED:0.04 QI:402/1/0.66/1/0/0/3/0/220
MVAHPRKTSLGRVNMNKRPNSLTSCRQGRKGAPALARSHSQGCCYQHHHLHHHHWHVSVVLVVFLSFFTSTTVSDGESTTVTTQTIGIVGGNADLFCNTTASSPSHPVILVIWYKNGGDPVYSYDLRGRAPNQAQHWADAHVLGNRANFYLSRPVDQWDNNGLLTRNPGDKRRPIEDRLPVGTSVLTIRGISTQDRGLYRCRVDFHAAPTRNSMANLTVV